MERKAVVLDRQGSTMSDDFHRARVVVRQCSLEFFSPSRSFRWQAAQVVTAGGEIDGSHVEARVHTAATAKSSLLGVEFVEVVKDAAYGDTLVVIQRMFKNSHSRRAGIQHQVLANEAAGIGEAIGELFAG